MMDDLHALEEQLDSSEIVKVQVSLQFMKLYFGLHMALWNCKKNHISESIMFFKIEILFEQTLIYNVECLL